MHYLKDNLRIFDNLIDTVIMNGKLLEILISKVPEMEPKAAGKLRNSNVSKILPLTTFRTIDLGGGKISGPLFSRFWAETRVFLSWDRRLSAPFQPEPNKTHPVESEALRACASS